MKGDVKIRLCKNCKMEYADELVEDGVCVYCRSEGLDDGEVGGAVPGDNIGQDELRLEPHGSEVEFTNSGFVVFP